MELRPLRDEPYVSEQIPAEVPKGLFLYQALVGKYCTHHRYLGPSTRLEAFPPPHEY